MFLLTLELVADEALATLGWEIAPLCQNPSQHVDPAKLWCYHTAFLSTSYVWVLIPEYTYTITEEAWATIVRMGWGFAGL